MELERNAGNFNHYLYHNLYFFKNMNKVNLYKCADMEVSSKHYEMKMHVLKIHIYNLFYLYVTIKKSRTIANIEYCIITKYYSFVVL